MNNNDETKGRRIVGASSSQMGSSNIQSYSSASQQQQQEDALKKVSLSEEHRTFWGNDLNIQWFRPKPKLSTIYIILLILFIITAYLYSKLLFSPAELLSFFGDNNNIYIQQDEINSIINQAKGS